MTAMRGDRELIVLARRIENLAYKLPAAEAALQERFKDLDAWKPRTMGDGMPHGTPESHAVESAMLARFEILDDLEMLAGRIEKIEGHVSAINLMADKALRGVVWRPEVVVCSSAGHEDFKVAWSKNKPLDEGNGWADPSCHDIAEEGGLCLRCSRRKERYLEHRDATADTAAPVEVAA